MKSIIRHLAVVGLVGVFLLVWGVEIDRDVADAQTPAAKIKANRLYTGTDGQSHVEEIEIDAGMLMKATGVQFGRAPAGRFSDWHVGPRRQFVITLSGQGELGFADGKKVTVGPGNINLVEDLTGKGHTTRSVGPGDRVTVSIPLADQTVKVGPSR
jgi:hypothetical protein